MKQLLFLLLFPCFAMAQYQGNGNQKITLGEQTTADGLVFRGVENDTALITPFSDTSAYIILDTINNKFYNYNRSTNVWSLAGGGGGGGGVTSFSAGTTGLTPSTATTGAVTLGGTLAVTNGGTNTSTAFTAGSVVFAGASGTYTQDNSGLFYNSTNKRLAVGQSQTLTGAALSIRGGLHIIDPDTTNGADANVYVYPKEQTTAGPNASELGFNLSGPGSVTTNDGPAFLLRGNNYNRVVNQRGLLLFSSGTNGVNATGGTTNIPAGGLNGKIVFYAQHGVDFTVNGADRMNITSAGNVGIGQTTPTAALHLKAGTASASSAPLKLTSGTNLTTAEAGAMEFNGTNLFFSPSTTRHTVNHGLTGSATLDFPSTTTLLSADLTITVTGAADGDVVSLGVPNAAVNANTCYTAWVSSANTVTVRFNNYSSLTVNPASGTFKVFVTK